MPRTCPNIANTCPNSSENKPKACQRGCGGFKPPFRKSEASSYVPHALVKTRSHHPVVDSCFDNSGLRTASFHLEGGSSFFLAHFFPLSSSFRLSVPPSSFSVCPFVSPSSVLSGRRPLSVHPSVCSRPSSRRHPMFVRPSVRPSSVFLLVLYLSVSPSLALSVFSSVPPSSLYASEV